MNIKEYVIINKTTILKRIEELKHQRELAGNLFEDIEYNLNYISTELRILEQILSESTPLIPVLENAFEHGVGSGKYQQEYGENAKGSLPVQDYISNLKLDI